MYSVFFKRQFNQSFTRMCTQLVVFLRQLLCSCFWFALIKYTAYWLTFITSYIHSHYLLQMRQSPACILLSTNIYFHERALAKLFLLVPNSSCYIGCLNLHLKYTNSSLITSKHFTHVSIYAFLVWWNEDIG